MKTGCDVNFYTCAVLCVCLCVCNCNCNIYLRYYSTIIQILCLKQVVSYFLFQNVSKRHLYVQYNYLSLWSCVATHVYVLLCKRARSREHPTLISILKIFFNSYCNIYLNIIISPLHDYLYQGF